MARKYFGYAREEGQNPYSGIMSFQHFRGERLYSDIVVRPEANMTETERVECYPVSPDAEERGREEGYYPDSTVVYIRVLWKEFEPERGVYNYAFTDEIMRQAREHGQTLLFRLMAHSTRASDDVPDWLKALIPCPERPEGKRVKASPTDPLFLDLFLEAVKKFGERYDGDDTLIGVDISLPGAWGEGYRLELYPDNTLERIVDVYTSVFKKTQLIGQAARPNLIRYGERVAPIGWRGDGLGEPEHTFEKYPSKVEAIKDVWKKAPVSFESYWWLCEWQRRGWDVDRIIQCTLDWHLTSFNPKSMPIPYEWKDKIEDWIAKMGYHYTVKWIEFPESAAAGERISVSALIENVGVAPIYHNATLAVRIKGEGGCVIAALAKDMRDVLPGEKKYEGELALPECLPSGEYSIDLGIIKDETAADCDKPYIYLATDAKRCGSFYNFGKIKIG